MLSNFIKTMIAGSILLASQLPLSAYADGEAVGAVYTMSNAADGNTVLMFDRGLNGKLTPAGEFSTEGYGTDGGLGNQGGLIIDPSNRWLFVVNAGSNEISVFAVEEDGLILVDREYAGGDRPISLANTATGSGLSLCRGL